MRRFVVRSQSIKTVGYDVDHQTLELEFHNGSVYDYHAVPPETVLALLDGRSIGAYVNQVIKSRFAATLVRDAGV